MPAPSPSDRAEAEARYPELSLLIGGTARPGRGGSVEVTDPATERTLGTLPLASPADMEDALTAASRGFEVWRRTPALERGRILHAIAARIRASAVELAELVTLEIGKPWAESLAEVEQAAGMFEWSAEEGRRAYGRVIPAREAYARPLAVAEPIGVVAGIASWNAPLVTPSRKISHALGAGCSIVMKASEDTPASALAIGRIAYDCGVPEGALSIVFGAPEVVAAAMIASEAVRAVTFTGSIRVGKLLSSQAMASMKRPVMELGGHAPVLVFADCDFDRTVAGAVATKFRNAGQICTSPTRFYVERSIYESFAEAMAEGAEHLQLGCGFAKGTTTGPLANPGRVAAIKGLIDDATEHGATPVTGGAPRDGAGHFFAPTVLRDVGVEARVSNEEPFGPIAALTPFDSFEEALTLSNRLPMGLSAFVHSGSIATVLRASEELQAGNVICNSWRVTVPETPFGGHGDSGQFAEGGPEGLAAFQKTKHIHLAG